jgi:hypothetical protein
MKSLWILIKKLVDLKRLRNCKKSALIISFFSKIYIFLFFKYSVKEYNDKWADRDIFKNFAQNHEVDYAKEKVRPQVESEVILIQFLFQNNIFR